MGNKSCGARGRGRPRIEWKEHLGKKLRATKREDVAGEGQEDIPVQPDAWKGTTEHRNKKNILFKRSQFISLTGAPNY